MQELAKKPKAKRIQITVTAEKHQLLEQGASDMKMKDVSEYVMYLVNKAVEAKSGLLSAMPIVL